MAMVNSARGRRLAPALTLMALVMAALLIAFAVAARPATAQKIYEHGTATACTDCHKVDTATPPTDADCQDCHTGGFTSRSGDVSRTCWSCHTPGQDMSTVQTAAGCGPATNGTAADGTTCHSGPRHFGSNMTTGCTTCHSVSVSWNDPGQSPHHSNTVYTAPTCTTSACHGAAPHPTYVPATDCVTCHAGMGTTHPAVAAMVAPAFTLVAAPAALSPGGSTVLSGSLKHGSTGLAGRTVTLQSTALGGSTWTAVNTTTTGAGGSYSFPAVIPVAATTYRAVVTGGLDGATTVRPALATVDVLFAPTVTITVSKPSIKLKAKITVSGTVDPARPGGSVSLLAQRKVGSKWVKAKSFTAILSPASAYTWSYKPPKKASYRVQASVPATSELAAVTTAWSTFKVK